MNLVDILIWGLLLLFSVKGFLKGLVRELCSLFGLVAGGWAAFKYYHYLAEVIHPFIHLPPRLTLVLAFFLIFFILGLLFFLFGHLLTLFFKIMLLGWVNRIGGMIFGLLEGALILCIALYFGVAKPVPEKVKAYLLSSMTAQIFISTGKEIITGWDNVETQPKLSPGKAN